MPVRFEVFPPSETLAICCLVSFGLLLRGAGDSLASILRDDDFLLRLSLSLLDDSGSFPFLPRLSLAPLLRAADLDVSNADRNEDRVLGFGDLDFDKLLCLSRLFRGGKDSSLLIGCLGSSFVEDVTSRTEVLPLRFAFLSLLLFRPWERLDLSNLEDGPLLVVGPV